MEKIIRISGNEQHVLYNRYNLKKEWDSIISRIKKKDKTAVINSDFFATMYNTFSGKPMMFQFLWDNN